MAGTVEGLTDVQAQQIANLIISRSASSIAKYPPPPMKARGAFEAPSILK